MTTEIESTGRTKVPRRRSRCWTGWCWWRRRGSAWPSCNSWPVTSSTSTTSSARSAIWRQAAVSRELGLALLGVFLPMAAAWSVALVPLRLLKPRPQFRRLSCQPGLVAGVAVISSALIMGLLVLTTALTNVVDVMQFVALFVPLGLGLAVVASWANLIAGRRWRPRSVLDRPPGPTPGRVLGPHRVRCTVSLAARLTTLPGPSVDLEPGCRFVALVGRHGQEPRPWPGRRQATSTRGSRIRADRSSPTHLERMPEIESLFRWRFLGTMHKISATMAATAGGDGFAAGTSPSGFACGLMG